MKSDKESVFKLLNEINQKGLSQEAGAIIRQTIFGPLENAQKKSREGQIQSSVQLRKHSDLPEDENVYVLDWSDIKEELEKLTVKRH